MSWGTSLVVLSVVCAASGFIDTGGDIQYRVVLDIFSGRPNPTWTIGRQHPLYSQIAGYTQRAPPTLLPSRLGYRGFYIETSNAFGQRASKTIGVGSNPHLEQMLFGSCPVPLHFDVRRHFVASMRGMTKYRNVYMSGKKWPPFKPKKLKFCKHPRYDPENWNFPPVQFDNNCYNYASQRQTHTYAQPGRASGQMYDEITAPNVMAATVRDGFVPLPFFAPKLFHGLCYMVLVIWPEVDFHFYRLDNNFRWSHKMGGTPVVDTDNSGNEIFDPRFADRGNYIVFAGFLGNHPGTVVE